MSRPATPHSHPISEQRVVVRHSRTFGDPGYDWQEQRRQMERLANLRMAQQERLAYEARNLTLEKQLLKATGLFQQQLSGEEGSVGYLALGQGLSVRLSKQECFEFPDFGEADNCKTREAYKKVYRLHEDFIQFKIDLSREMTSLIHSPGMAVTDFRCRFNPNALTNPVDLPVNGYLLGAMASIAVLASSVLFFGVGVGAASSLGFLPPLAIIGIFVSAIVSIAHLINAYRDKNISEKTQTFDHQLHVRGEALAEKYASLDLTIKSAHGIHVDTFDEVETSPQAYKP